jgi:S-adenosylmethionine synthetase
VGYTRAKYGFDGDTCAVVTAIDEQSPDIAQGVDRAVDAADSGTGGSEQLGAGDQGMMFGYACRETPELMPLPIALAHRLVKQLAHLRKSEQLEYLRPDGKAQVSVEYVDGVPQAVTDVVVSTQHAPSVSLEVVKRDVVNRVIREVIGADYLTPSTRFYVNPTGRFVIGGPHGDSGLTGRKIIVDTYGGYARHGGGAFSGKDPTKVDRAGSYAARYVAKNVVAAGLAEKCELEVAYAIGVAEPVSVNVRSLGIGVIPDERIEELVREHFDLRPGVIIEELELRRPIYRPLAAYGHLGREDLGVSWEQTDRVELLREAAGLPDLASEELSSKRD